MKSGTLVAVPIGLPQEAFSQEGSALEIGGTIPADQAVGFDLRIEPKDGALEWEFWKDDVPWPKAEMFAGPYGLASPEISAGIASRDARKVARAYHLPTFMPEREAGLFAILKGGDAEGGVDTDARGGEEMSQILKDWGYAKEEKKKP